MPAELLNNGPAPVVPATPAAPVAPAAPAAAVPAAPAAAAPATPAAPAPDPNKDAIAELSRRVGRDLSRFGTVEAARAAHDMIVESYLQASSRPPAPAPAPQSFDAPVEDDSDDDDLYFEDDATPPAPKKTARKTKRERELEKRLAKIEAQTAQRERQQEEALDRMVQSRAVKAIDALKSERFGDSRSWNPTQRWNANELYNLALGIARGAGSFGHVLTIEDAIHIAASRIEPAAVAAPAAPAAPALPPPPEPRSGSLHLPSGGDPAPRPVDSRYGATNAAIINDPEFRAAAARIGRA